MRNLTIAILSILLLPTVVKAQFNISTDYMAEYVWNAKSEDWDIQREDKKTTSFFELNQDLTMLKHTTPQVTSTFKIKEEEHNNDNGSAYYMLNIVSDIGRDYFLIFDFKEGSIKVTPEDKSFMILYRIKGTWTD